MVIDYEHQTLAGTEAPASGWIKAMKGLIDRGAEGIWAVGVEWTDKARTYIANREYRYVSPVFLVRKSDQRVIELINVALTNQPNIDGMVPMINKRNQQNEEVGMKKLFNLLGLPETATEAEVCIAVNKLIQSGVMANKVLTALGLGADADEAAAIGAVTAMKDQAAVMTNKEVLTALGLATGASASEATATILAMKQGATALDTLSGEVAALRTKLAEKDSGDIVALAMKDGKITPAQEPWAKEYAARDLAGFQMFVAKAPVVVPIKTVDGGRVSDASATDDVQLQVNKMLGISNETFTKHNKEGGE
jgi:phage I-like protein